MQVSFADAAGKLLVHCRNFDIKGARRGELGLVL